MNNRERIVIVGYAAAGMTAAGYAKTYSRLAEVTVFEKRSYAIYHPCSIHDVLMRVLPGWELIIEEPPKMPGFNVYISTEVEDIDPNAKMVYAKNLKTGKKVKTEYDKLILATGSIPFIPSSIKIEDKDKVYTIKTVEDGRRLEEEAEKAKSVVVIGGSFIGIEMGYALAKRGLQVTILEYFQDLMYEKLEKRISKLLLKKLQEKGINVVLGEGANAIFSRGGKKVVSTATKEFKADFVVVATGSRPNIELAKKMGVEIGSLGGIKVDNRMQTSVPDVYAAGDNVESLELISRKPVLSLLASTAVRQGRVAGINVVGGNDFFPGTVNAWIVNLHDFQFGATGITKEYAEKIGYKPVSVGLSTYVKPGMYSENQIVNMQIVLDSETHRVLGFHILGERDVALWLDVMTQVIIDRKTVEDVARIELVYTPSVRECIDPLHKLADSALRRLRR